MNAHSLLDRVSPWRLSQLSSPWPFTRFSSSQNICVGEYINVLMYRYINMYIVTHVCQLVCKNIKLAPLSQFTNSWSPNPTTMSYMAGQSANISIDQNIFISISIHQKIPHYNHIFQRQLPTGPVVENFHAMGMSQQVSDMWYICIKKMYRYKYA